MKKGWTKKGLFAVLLIAVLMLSAMTAFAAEGDVATPEEFKAAVGNSDVSVINVAADMDLTGVGVLDVSGKTISLNGNTISAKNSH